MKKAFLFLFITPLVLVNLLGCWFIAGSAVGAVGAYAVGKDTVQGKTDKPYDSLWNAALTVSRIRGTIKIEDGAKGYIELEAESSRTWIRLIRLTRTATRLRISCRKHKLPNLALAEDLFAKIMEEAR